MKKLIIKPLPKAYQKVLIYLLAFFIFILLNFSVKINAPICISALCGLSMTELSPIILSILAILSGLLKGGLDLALTTAISAGVLCVIFILYRARNSAPKYELVFYISASLIRYLFFSGEDFYLKAIVTVAIIVLAFISIANCHYIVMKGLKYQPTGEEFIMLSVQAVLLILGFIQITSVKTVWVLAIFLLLVCCRVFDGAMPFIVSFILSLPFAIYSADIKFVGGFIFLAFIAYFSTNISHYVAGIAVIFTDYLLYLIFNVHESYSAIDISLTTAVVLFFFVLPNSFFNRIKEDLSLSQNKLLTKQTINRYQLKLREKLFDLSNVFYDLSFAFDEFKRSEISETDARNLISNKIYEEVCLNCNKLSHCQNFRQNAKKEINDDLNKTVKIGMAKGKISFIDLPKSMSEKCFNTNALIYAINKELADYRAVILENVNFSLSRELVAKQAEGVAVMLKTLANDSTKELEYDNALEEKLLSLLRKKGITPLEVLIYGKDNDKTVTLVLLKAEFNAVTIEKCASTVTNTPITILSASELPQEKVFIMLAKATPYTAIFGVAKEKKALSDASGDTHTEVFIPGKKALFALSDGMGSGKNAETVSSVTLSLIENFYRTGLNSDVIIALVNKMLTINTTDTFSALDVMTVDLNNLQADFIKFGSPKSYIITETGIKIVEGNTLPIGIIKEITPDVVSTTLSVDDLVIFMSDGVADSFNSTSEIFDFLKNLTAKNPQNVADLMLEKARELSNGFFKDDVCVLAVRIIKNK